METKWWNWDMEIWRKLETLILWGWKTLHAKKFRAFHEFLFSDEQWWSIFIWWTIPWPKRSCEWTFLFFSFTILERWLAIIRSFACAGRLSFFEDACPYSSFKQEARRNTKCRCSDACYLNFLDEFPHQNENFEGDPIT